MKKIILLLLINLSIAYSYAQLKLRDSLKLSIQKEKNDTSLVKLLNRLSYTYSTTNTDSSIQLSIKALGLARRAHYAKGEALSLQFIGWGYFLSGNYPKAMTFFLQSLKVYEKIKDANGIGAVYNGIGTVYSEQGDYQQALKYLHESNSLFINKNGSIPANIGRVYRFLKNYDSARFYTEQALDIAYKTKDPRRMGWFLSERALLHAEMDENNLAVEYFRMSIPYTLYMDDYFGLCAEYLGLAKVLEKTGHADSGFYYAKMAVSIARQNRLPLRIVEASTYLSALYKNKGNADSALLYMGVAKTANDSLFSQQKLQELKTLSFDEQLRQQEIAAAELKAKDERSHNLQYAAIVIGLITFIILFFLLSRSIVVKTKFIEFFGVLGLLAVFEFINLFIHPYLSHATNDSPVLMLAVLIAIGALLIPLHHKLEKWITKIMVEKNKKIRLEAAKKTIQQLEG